MDARDLVHLRFRFGISRFESQTPSSAKPSHIYFISVDSNHSSVGPQTILCLKLRNGNQCLLWSPDCG